MVAKEMAPVFLCFLQMPNIVKAIVNFYSNSSSDQILPYVGPRLSTFYISSYSCAFI
jgi:hypothetical protein